VFVGFVKDVAATLSAFDLSVFPVALGRHAAHRIRSAGQRQGHRLDDADGLTDILDEDKTAWIVPRRDAAALARRIVHAIEHPDERASMSARAREAARDFDINAFVRKMERLYPLLHDLSRPTRRQGILREDLSFLDRGVPA
jgi:hypothetical protein